MTASPSPAISPSPSPSPGGPASQAAGSPEPGLISLPEAAARLRADHDLLLTRVTGLTGDELAASCRLDSGPLGDFCDSLHDLVAHVLMWDEISLAVLTEAAAGRAHWSLDPRWETADAGRRLNRGGVEAGRHVPAALLLHRFRAAGDALAAVFGQYTERDWTAPGQAGPAERGIGALARHVFTVPGQPAFWHAAVHLNQLPASAAAQRSTTGLPDSRPR
ncbi:MAG TPA: maleylpyruvate isomerase N-terminal domain-containing protein [Streptosporangiaceae bacterium]|nr:maleylpyruvate isomerase N-terminal domain-containing protein [Streptosporangiaceae bacterium]